MAALTLELRQRRQFGIGFARLTGLQRDARLHLLRVLESLRGLGHELLRCGLRLHRKLPRPRRQRRGLRRGSPELRLVLLLEPLPPGGLPDRGGLPLLDPERRPDRLQRHPRLRLLRMLERMLLRRHSPVPGQLLRHRRNRLPDRQRDERHLELLGHHEPRRDRRRDLRRGSRLRAVQDGAVASVRQLVWVDPAPKP
jgi:hypothetical protein